MPAPRRPNNPIPVIDARAGIKDRTRPTSLYFRIQTVLRDRILSGQYADGALPGEHELSAEFKVSRVTIRKALEALQLESLVVREQGRGTFAHPDLASRPVVADVSGLMDNLLALGMRTSSQVLEFDYVPAPPAVAQMLGLAPDTVVQRAVRLRSYKRQPFSLATSWIVEDVGRSWTRADLVSTPLLVLLDRAGIVIVGAHQRITATAAEAHVGALLGLAMGAPLLQISRVVSDQSARPIEFIQVLYRPDRYEFEVTMTRDGETAGLWQTVMPRA